MNTAKHLRERHSVGKESFTISLSLMRRYPIYGGSGYFRWGSCGSEFCCDSMLECMLELEMSLLHNVSEETDDILHLGQSLRLD